MSNLPFNTPALCRRLKAFTLVELLVVLAIISILAAVALPAYNNYSLKSKFAEVILATAPTKSAISACAAAGDCVSGSQISLGSGGSAAATPYVGGSSTYNARLGWEYAWLCPTYATPAAANAGHCPSAQPITYYVHDASEVILCNASTCNIGGGTGAGVPLSVFNNFYNSLNAANPDPIPAATSLAALPCVGGSGCSPATKYAATVSYDATGIITGTAQSSSGLKAETFVLIPALSGGRVDWEASGTCKTRAGGALC